MEAPFSLALHLSQVCFLRHLSFWEMFRDHSSGLQEQTPPLQNFFFFFASIGKSVSRPFPTLAFLAGGF